MHVCANVKCRDITQYLTAGVQELGIGTYVTDPTPENPFGPVATATLQTTVFDVVHMFSEQGISSVPIVDAEGKVVNLYETVDVIVSVICLVLADIADACSSRRVPITRLHDCTGTQAAHS